MFRPIRTLFLMAMMFITGIFYERYQNGVRCVEIGGKISGELCLRDE